MLPEKRKNLIIILVIIVLVILAVYGGYFLSKFVKEKDKNPKIDFDYPESAMYFGIIKDDSNFNKGIVLDSEFNEISNKINLFYPILSYKVSDNNKLLFYSDAFNQLTYNKKEKTFFIKEIDSKISNLNGIQYGKNFIVYVTDSNELFMIDNDDNSFSIAKNVDSNFAIIDNYIYYTLDNDLKAYNVVTKNTLNIKNKIGAITDFNKNLIVFKDYVYYIKSDEFKKIEEEVTINFDEIIPKEKADYCISKDICYKEKTLFNIIDNQKIKEFNNDYIQIVRLKNED